MQAYLGFSVMAQITNLPPQAYTRDTLVKAIDWVNTQSPAVRERANSADLVVSYYLQARRRTDAQQMEAPISGEAFKADLKHLAQDLKKFEEPAPPQPAPTTLNRSFSPSRTEEMIYQPAQAPAFAPAPPPSQAQPVTKDSWPVDARSLDNARVVQHRLNLGSEHEALRLLITLGMERFRGMFP
jgi:hypothetical protein